jgi:hypothetical protein
MVFHRIRRTLAMAAVAIGLVVVPAALPSATAAPTAPAAQDPGVAVTCYGGSVPITLPPSGYSAVYTTSSRCQDINLRIDAGGGQWVAVCWARTNTCQSSWTWVPEDVGYRVVATDVLDGTTFYFVTTGGGGNRTGRAAF